MMYLFNFILFSAVFWGLYRILLKRETFFKANRFYLLIVPVLAAVIPFMKVEFLNLIPKTQGVIHLPEINLLSNQGVSEVSERDYSITLNTVLISIYILGVLISSFLFFRRLYQLQKFKTQGIKRKFQSTEVIYLSDSHGAFTFLKTIFLGDQFDKEQELKIIEHELEHIRQSHYLDLIYYEVLRIFMWFNPFIYVLQQELTEIHEYSVDRKIIKNHSKKSYVENLLRVGLNSSQFSFTNSFFNQKILKTRVMMLYKNSSSKKSSLKYLAVIFSSILMLIYVSCDSSGTEEQTAVQAEKTEKTERVKLEDMENSNEIPAIPFQAVETTPEFYDSPEFTSKEERKKYFSKKVSKLFSESFDMDKAQEVGYEGINRIAVQFEIDETGAVTNIKARAQQEAFELEDLTIAAVSQLPRVKPAEVKGSPVRTIYQLPVIFRNDKKEKD